MQTSSLHKQIKDEEICMRKLDSLNETYEEYSAKRNGM